MGASDASTYPPADIQTEPYAPDAGLETEDYSGKTALMRSAAEGNIDEMRRFLALGANVNHRNAFGQTALMWAAARDRDSAVATLLAAGADIHLRAANGETAFDISLRTKGRKTRLLLKKAGATRSGGPKFTLLSRLRRRLREAWRADEFEEWAMPMPPEEKSGLVRPVLFMSGLTLAFNLINLITPSESRPPHGALESAGGLQALLLVLVCICAYALVSALASFPSALQRLAQLLKLRAGDPETTRLSPSAASASSTTPHSGEATTMSFDADAVARLLARRSTELRRELGAVEAEATDTPLRLARYHGPLIRWAACAVIYLTVAYGLVALWWLAFLAWLPAWIALALLARAERAFRVRRQLDVQRRADQRAGRLLVPPLHALRQSVKRFVE